MKGTSKSSMKAVNTTATTNFTSTTTTTSSSSTNTRPPNTVTKQWSQTNSVNATKYPSPKSPVKVSKPSPTKGPRLSSSQHTKPSGQPQVTPTSSKTVTANTTTTTSSNSSSSSDVNQSPKQSHGTSNSKSVHSPQKKVSSIRQLPNSVQTHSSNISHSLSSTTSTSSVTSTSLSTSNPSNVRGSSSIHLTTPSTPAPIGTIANSGTATIASASTKPPPPPPPPHKSPSITVTEPDTSTVYKQSSSVKGGGVTEPEVTHRLRALDRVEDFWAALEALFEELMCCENFYTQHRITHCTKCARQSPAQVKREQETSVKAVKKPSPQKRRASEETSLLSQSSPAKIKKSASEGSGSQSNGYQDNSNSSIFTTNTTSTSTPSSYISSPTQENGVTLGGGIVTSPIPKPKGDPADWTVEEVIAHISATDLGLASHADLFRRHEIDGKALMLLTSDMMMKYMGLKLGPALKICHLISKIKGRRHLSL
ncbi:Polycomb protein Scm [Armadillidium vulgare]|nr:Polycomb protein Scm [Armadillidium vulgare]